MRELVAQEEHQGPECRGDPDAFAPLVNDEFAPLVGLPAVVEVGDQREHAVGCASEGVQVALVEVTRIVDREVTLEGEQAEQQASVQVQPQVVRPGDPGGRLSLDPANAIAAHESVRLVAGLPADAGAMEVRRLQTLEGLHQIRTESTGQRVRQDAQPPPLEIVGDADEQWVVRRLAGDRLLGGAHRARSSVTCCGGWRQGGAGLAMGGNPDHGMWRPAIRRGSRPGRPDPSPCLPRRGRGAGPSLERPGSTR